MFLAIIIAFSKEITKNTFVKNRANITTKQKSFIWHIVVHIFHGKNIHILNSMHKFGKYSKNIYTIYVE